VNHIAQSFDKTGLTWMLHITGGEPFIFPNFVNLCKLLTQKHFININSNLSQRSIYKFAEVIDPSRVSFINVGVHTVEREKRKLVDDLITKNNLLKEKGFYVFFSYVMHPSLFERYENDFNFYKNNGIFILPKAIRGVIDGKRYPNTYTKDEITLFKNYATKALSYLKSDRIDGTTPLIDLSLDEEFIEGIPSFHGLACSAGKNFVRIWPDGTVTQCDRDHNMGNIYEGTMKLRTATTICNTFSCPYFCYKFSTFKVNLK
jgi:organic radical activating enzyme